MELWYDETTGAQISASNPIPCHKRMIGRKRNVNALTVHARSLRLGRIAGPWSDQRQIKTIISDCCNLLWCFHGNGHDLQARQRHIYGSDQIWHDTRHYS